MSSREPRHTSETLGDIHALAQSAIAEMSGLVFGLCPETLQREGVVAALVKLAATVRTRQRLDVRTRLELEPGIPLHVKEALYRVGQEALNNAVKHSRATSLQLSLVASGSEVVLQIADNGRGFDQRGSFPGHLGLRSMRERLTAVGGALEIQSAPGEGTQVQARVPLVSLVASEGPRHESADEGVYASLRCADDPYACAQARAVLEERKRVAHELHESVSPALFAVALKSATARQCRHSRAGQFLSVLREIHRLAQSALAELREMIFELRLSRCRPTAPASRRHSATARPPVISNGVVGMTRAAIWPASATTCQSPFCRAHRRSEATPGAPEKRIVDHLALAR